MISALRIMYGMKQLTMNKLRPFTSFSMPDPPLLLESIMPSYKLLYHNSRGHGETARMLFALAEVEYEDHRFTHEEWATIKPTTPFFQAPMLEVDGVLIAQSLAIYRCLARAFGYAGSTPLEEARADMIVECIREAAQPLRRVHQGMGEEEKAAFIKKVSEENLPPQMGKINDFLGNKKFFLGEKISWVDIYYYNIMPYFKLMGFTVPFDKYPNLQTVMDRVAQEPKIAVWIKNRPVTAH